MIENENIRKYKKDSQAVIDTFNNGINKKNDKNEDLKERFSNEKDIEKINNDKEDLNKLKRKVVKTDSQTVINTFKNEVNKKNDKNEKLIHK